MADDKAKKTKIDLKARLGKTTTMGLQPPMPMPTPVPGSVPMAPSSDPNGQIPGAPASAPGGPSSSQVPPPAIAAPQIAPPPAIAAGLSPGIPLPPFARQPVQRAAPEPKPSAAQQTIKVEMGEEIIQERKKMRSRMILFCVLTAAVGGGIGFVAGGSKSTGDRAKRAAAGAGLIEKDVKAANDKMKDLDAALTAASEKLKNKVFPEDLIAALGGLKIPFETSNLDNKDAGSLPPRVLKPLLNYTSMVEDVDKSRETLKNLLGLTKDPVTKFWAEEKTPMANFAVVFRSEGGKEVADLVPLSKPFQWRGDFPEKLGFSRTEGGKPVDKTATRWVKGDLNGSDPVGIPVDPKSTAAFTGEVMIARLSKAVFDLRSDLEGNSENPQNPVPGLMKVGDDLVDQLGKFALNQ